MQFTEFVPFDGTVSRITVLDDDLPTGNSPRTLEAWVRLSTLSNFVQPIVNYGGSYDKGSFGLSINPWGQPYFFGWNNDLNGKTVVSDGEWHKITAVYDGKQIKIYVDGALDTIASQGNTGRVYPYSQLNTASTDSLVMGQVEAFTSEAGQFKGDIKSIQIWNYAIDDNAIANEIFSSGNEEGLVYSFVNGELDNLFDINSSAAPRILTSISNVSGVEQRLITGIAQASSQISFFDEDRLIGSVRSDINGRFSFTVPNLEVGLHSISAVVTDNQKHVSEPSNRIVFTIEQGNIFEFDDYISFNGSVSRIIIRDDDLPAGNTERTLETWVRLSSLGDQVQPIINYGSLDRNASFGLSINPLGQLYFFGRNDLNGNMIVSDGDWHKLTLVYDAETIKLYVDGQLDLVADQGNTGDIDLYSSLDTAYVNQSVIGQVHSFTSSEGQFHGDIKSIRIWNYAIDADAIRASKFSSGDDKGLIYSFLIGEIEEIPKQPPTGAYNKDSNFYIINLGPDAIHVEDRASGLIDTYTNISALTFSDLTLDLTLVKKTAALDKTDVTELVELYIASFNRAPDALGLNYWGSRVYDGMALSQVAKSFFVQPETVAAYPSSQSVEFFVDRVYNNVLSRSPDGSGMAYWKEAIESGRIGKDVFLLAIINGAKAETGSAQDKQTLINKTLVGMDYAFQEGLSNITWAKDVMASVNSTSSSVQDAYHKTDGYALKASTSATAELVVKVVGVWDSVPL